MGHKRTEITYAGTDKNAIASLDMEGLTKNQIKNLRVVGKNILDFLGSQDDVDEYGFYTLWSEESADVLPKQRRKSPK